MTDLHVLLYEPWCPTCGGSSHHGGCLSQVPPLATRMPEAVPEGLDHGSAIPGNSDQNSWYINGAKASDEQAELLFLGNALKILTGGKLSFQIHASCDPAWMTAALHRFCDERDAAKERS